MRKLLKWTGLSVGSLVLVVVLAVAVVYAASEVRFRRAYSEVAVSPLRAAQGNPAALERGRHLATAINKCVDCHGGDMGGKLFMDAGPLGVVYASNLTSGKGGVLARYTDGQLERAIRHGVDADGHALAIMPSADYWTMGDADVQALIAYIRTLPPVDRELPTTNVRALGRALYLAGKLPLFPAERITHAASRAEPPVPGVTVEYGRYLATIGGCLGCHGKDLAGAAEVRASLDEPEPTARGRGCRPPPTSPPRARWGSGRSRTSLTRCAPASAPTAPPCARRCPGHSAGR